MDFFELFLGPIGRLLFGWQPAVFEPAVLSAPAKGGHQIDPDG